jgi:general secretion pathway protein D
MNSIIQVDRMKLRDRTALIAFVQRDSHGLVCQDQDRIFRPTMFKILNLGIFLLSLLLLAACVTEPSFPLPLDLPKKVADYSTLQQEETQLRETAMRVSETPKPPPPERLQTGKTALPTTVATEEKANVVLSFEQIPLPSFIQAVYAAILKKTVNLDPKVVERKDLVTLRTGEPQTLAQVESATRLLLKSYGIAVVEMGGMVRIVPDNAALGYLPEIRRGRALPDTPLPLRPIFQLVELEAVRNTDIASWIRLMFGDKVKLQEDPGRNAVILSGTSDDVMAAMEAIHILDQPLMKGRQSFRISPLYWSADELAKRLGEILQAEGYSTGTTVAGSVSMPVTVLPVAAVNSVFVFAASSQILDHVIEWAKELDKPNEKGVGRSFFTYQALYTDAQALAATLDKLLSGAVPKIASTTASGSAVPAASTLARVVVDNASNSLIFQGNNEDYGQIRSLLQGLDKPSKEALIEVTVAEVALSDNSQLGVEWLLKEAKVDGTLMTLGTLGGLSIGSAGLNFRRIDSAGNVRLLINALASNNRATILSSPRIVARNGETAIIQVGQEVPIITSQQTSPTTGSTGSVLQTVQYRTTGVILNVKPVIHSGDQVDLDVTQEVSSAQTTTTGVNTSPTFSTRKLQTKLSLKNGATVLLGGLISSSKSEGNAGIPFLKDIPLLGQAFRTDTTKNDRTELIILITPYIIADDNDAAAVTSAFRKQLGGWAQPQPKKLTDPNKIETPSEGNSDEHKN